jgi:hypothetical protein
MAVKTSIASSKVIWYNGEPFKNTADVTNDMLILFNSLKKYFEENSVNWKLSTNVNIPSGQSTNTFVVETKDKRHSQKAIFYLLSNVIYFGYDADGQLSSAQISIGSPPTLASPPACWTGFRIIGRTGATRNFFNNFFYVAEYDEGDGASIYILFTINGTAGHIGARKANALTLMNLRTSYVANGENGHYCIAFGRLITPLNKSVSKALGNKGDALLNGNWGWNSTNPQVGFNYFIVGINDSITIADNSSILRIGASQWSYIAPHTDSTSLANPPSTTYNSVHNGGYDTKSITLTEWAIPNGKWELSPLMVKSFGIVPLITADTKYLTGTLGYFRHLMLGRLSNAGFHGSNIEIEDANEEQVWQRFNPGTFFHLVGTWIADVLADNPVYLLWNKTVTNLNYTI